MWWKYILYRNLVYRCRPTVDCDSQVVAGACKLLYMSDREILVNSCINLLNWIYCKIFALISLVISYIYAFYTAEIKGISVYIGDLTFEVHAQAMRHVMEQERTPTETISKPSDLIEKHTNYFKHGYIIFFKKYCAQQKFHTTWSSVIMVFIVKQMTPIWHKGAAWWHTVNGSCKIAYVGHLAKGNGSGCDTCLQDCILTW